MVRSLPRCVDVRMIIRSQLEARASVLQCKAASFGNDAAAEGRVDAVDETDTIAFFICDGEIYGVTGVLCRAWIAVRWRVLALGRGEELCPFDQVLLRNEVGGSLKVGRVVGMRIGNPPICVGESDAERFDNRMQIFRRVVIGC